MDKSLLLVVIFLGAFSLFKAAMLIMVGMAMKPKVDEDGNIVKPVEEEGEEKQLSVNEDDSDFWGNWWWKKRPLDVFWLYNFYSG